MTAKCEVNTIGQGWVMLVEKDLIKHETEGNKPGVFPKELMEGEDIIYYTENIPDSLAHVVGDGSGKGCSVNGERLRAGKSMMIGNLKIIGT